MRREATRYALGGDVSELGGRTTAGMSDRAEGVVLVDGRPVDAALPLRAVCYGEGVFETMRTAAGGGLPRLMGRHMERLLEGCRVLGIPAPLPSDVEAMVVEALRQARLPEARIKVAVLAAGVSVPFHAAPRSATVLVQVVPLEPHRPDPPRLALTVSPYPHPAPSALTRIKHLNYLLNVLAAREARRRGYDEALLLGPGGEVVEGSYTNVFWFQGDVLYAPSPECGALPGITRSVVLGCASACGIEVREGVWGLDAFHSCDGAFVTNSVLGVVPVGRVEGRALPEHRLVAPVRRWVLEELGWGEE